MRNDIDPGEVILEFVQIGALIRVSAMEPKSLTEVVIYGPASAGEAALRRVVLRKLDYVLGRQPAPRASWPANPTPADDRGDRPGLAAFRSRSARSGCGSGI